LKDEQGRPFIVVREYVHRHPVSIRLVVIKLGHLMV
jgi:hypothetical protein